VHERTHYPLVGVVCVSIALGDAQGMEGRAGWRHDCVECDGTRDRLVQMFAGHGHVGTWLSSTGL